MVEEWAVNFTVYSQAPHFHLKFHFVHSSFLTSPPQRAIFQHYKSTCYIAPHLLIIRIFHQPQTHTFVLPGLLGDVRQVSFPPHA